MRDDALTNQIIGAAIEVHRTLGPGLLESAYQTCLAHEMALRGIGFRQQQPLPVVYKDVKLARGYCLDFVVERTVVLELKAVEALHPIHDAQMITYLKLSGYTLGLLINFNSRILKDGIRRIVLNHPD